MRDECGIARILSRPAFIDLSSQLIDHLIPTFSCASNIILFAWQPSILRDLGVVYFLAASHVHDAVQLPSHLCQAR